MWLDGCGLLPCRLQWVYMLWLKGQVAYNGMVFVFSGGLFDGRWLWQLLKALYVFLYDLYVLKGFGCVCLRRCLERFCF